MECIVHHLGLALGGRPAASSAKRLMVPVSNDTLLRVVRRRACSPADPLSIVGIDDWAFRRNHRYGTIVCDLERRRIVTLLPDGEIATVKAWLADHPEIGIVARDRGGGYGEATAAALPNAIQVADRWHLMENASAAFLAAVRKSMRAIRTALGVNLRREETNAAIMKLADEGIPIKEIVRRTGNSRKLIRQIVRGERTDVFRIRQNSLPAFIERLRASEAMAARALEFLILTACRTQEVLKAQWDEIDFDAALWVIPAARMKMKRDHRVPLPDLAVDILKALHEARASEFVFPGQVRGKPLSNMAMEMLMKRMKVRGASPHGFRSLFRDWAGDCTAFPREIGEAALAHKVGDLVELAYRRGDALKKRCTLMQAWADYCCKTDGKVIPLRAS